MAIIALVRPMKYSALDQRRLRNNASEKAADGMAND